MRGVGDTASKQQARRGVEMEGAREQRRIDPKFAVPLYIGRRRRGGSSTL